MTKGRETLGDIHKLNEIGGGFMKHYSVSFNNSNATQSKRGQFIAEVDAIDERDAASKLKLNKFYLTIKEVSK